MRSAVARVPTQAEVLALAPYFWFRGDAYTPTGGEAESLTDLSGNARHGTQANAALRATTTASSAAFGGQPTFVFAAGDYYETPSYALGPFTVLFVGLIGGNLGTAWSHDANNTYLQRSTGLASSRETGAGRSTVTSNTAMSNTARIYLANCPAQHSGHLQRWNGVAQAVTANNTGNPGAGTTSAISYVNEFGALIGFGLSAASEIAELILFPELTSPQQQTVESYAHARYGL